MTCRVKHRSAATAAKCPDCRARRADTTNIGAPPQPARAPRPDGSVRVTHHPNGTVSQKEYFHEGRHHREGGPALIRYYPDGTVMEEMYCRHGDIHREDEPAKIVYHKGGAVSQESFFLYGNLHRKDGPAMFLYREDGSVESKRYFRNGQQHRDDGPGLIVYHKGGRVKRTVCFHEDKQVPHREALHRYLTKLHPEMSPENTAAFEWLEPYCGEDPKTRAFVPPDPNLVAVALSMFENPAARSQS